MEELKNIKVALLGSGTVGTGVYKLIERQREELPQSWCRSDCQQSSS